MHKKGASSLEFILAFVLFASFTVAALYFFNPVKTLKNMDYSRDYTLNKIIEDTSVELDSYSIVIREPIPQKISISISGETNKNVRAVDYEGVVVDAKRGSGNDFCVDISNIKPIYDNKFTTLYFSEEIVESAGPSCIPNPDETNYNIASSLTEKVISENRILSLNKSYGEDYSALKNRLNIPADVDFSFSLVLGETKIVAGNSQSGITREIFSETNRMEVLRTSGVPQFGELTVSVW